MPSVRPAASFEAVVSTTAEIAATESSGTPIHNQSELPSAPVVPAAPLACSPSAHCRQRNARFHLRQMPAQTLLEVVVGDLRAAARLQQLTQLRGLTRIVEHGHETLRHG